MEKCRVVFSGSGGQGVVTAAIILAEAAVLHEGLEAVQSQSYGAAARGGTTRSDVILSEDPIDYPKVIQPNVLIALTQDAYNHYHRIIRPGGLLITDRHFVVTSRKVDALQVELALYDTLMEQIKKPVVFNIAVLGALVGLRPLVKTQSIYKVLQERFPWEFLAVNRLALDLGFSLARLKG
jgi:2-oxoglutarate ferredoxin oxidoreductase subunit gamma